MRDDVLDVLAPIGVAIVGVVALMAIIFACLYWAGVAWNTQTVIHGHCVILQNQASMFSPWHTIANSCVSK